MKYLVLSDMHANLEALEATLHAAGSAYDRVLVLGDLVGYGADPNAVIDQVRRLPVATLIRGNHDKVATGLGDVEGFNRIAREAIAWTASALTDENRAWLAALPPGPVLIDDTVEICHGTPFDEDMYVFEDLDALRALRAARRPLCLYGHTHVPAVFELDEHDTDALSIGIALDLIGPPRGSAYSVVLDPQLRYLANCGAVGQPRDGDPRAAYGVLDTNARTLAILRVEYDVPTAQAKIVRAGLPPVLAQRLALGR